MRTQLGFFATAIAVHFASAQTGVMETKPTAPLQIVKEKLCESGTVNDVLFTVYREPSYIAEWTLGLEYLTIEVVAVCEGRETRSSAAGKFFSDDQKEIFRKCDAGSSVIVDVRYREHPSRINPVAEVATEKRMKLNLLVRAAQPAQYPGGFVEMMSYLRKTVFQTIGGPEDTESETSKKLESTILRFVVLDNGQIGDVKIERSSTDESIDRALLDAVRKMPEWKPAQSIKGERIKEILSLSMSPKQGC